MQITSMTPFIILAGLGTSVFATKSSPLAGVISMLNDLKVKVESDGAAEDRAYGEFFGWCDRVTGEELHAIQLDEEQLAKLKADIQKYFAEIESYGETISEEAKAIAATIEDAKKAKDLREKQYEEFKSAESELVATVDMLSRAIAVLEENMKKGSSFAQVINKKMPELVEILDAITNAAAFSTSDRSKLLQLVQESQESDEASAPAAEVYTSKGGSIIEVLEDMKDKADNHLADLRKGEQQARYVFKQLRIALKNQQKADEKDLTTAKKGKAESQEDEAEAESDEKQTEKVLDVETEEYSTTKAHCMQTASDHEISLKSRKEELRAIKEATSILKSKASGADALSLFQQKSMQLVSLHTSSDLAGFEAMTLVSRMSKMHHSAALAQLASQMSSVIHSGASNQNVFTKIKDMIKGLVAKLEKEQEEEATEKAYCDDEMSKTKNKKGELEEQIEDLGAHLDQSKAKSTQIKEDVMELQKQLVFVEKEQVDLDKIRKDEHDVFLKSKTDLELGIEGVREAHALLKDFYASKDEETSDASPSFVQVLRQPTPPEVDTNKNSNAAGTIMSILEVTESDFASSLAKAQTEEANAQAEYDKATQEHALEKAAKEQEVKFKTKEFKRLDKKVVQLSDDKDSTKSEQAAVLDFYAKLKDRCVAEPSSFEVRKKKREAEIMGLKEAQEILKNEAAFAQRQSFGRRLRGNH